jgi:hypothetical protein
MLERQERCRAEGVVVQIGHGRARVLEPLDDHPLQALAQHGLDGAFHPGRDFEEIGHGDDDPVTLIATPVG